MHRGLNALALLAVWLIPAFPSSLTLAESSGKHGTDDCCQPNLEDYYRKKKSALQLYQAAEKQLDESLEHFEENLKDLGSDLVQESEKWGVPKLGAVTLLSRFKASRLKKLEEAIFMFRTARLAAQAEAAAALIEIAEWVALGATVIELADLGFYVRQAFREMDDAKRMVDAANAMMDQALAALDQALKQSAACEKEREQRRQPVKSLDDRAHELRESWDNNGYLYQDPWGGPPLDAQAALERAKQILLQGSSRRSSQFSKAHFAHAETTAEGGSLLTAQEADELISVTSRGKDLYSKAFDHLVRWWEAWDGVQRDMNTFQRELDDLDARTDAVSRALAKKCVQPCKPIDNSNCPPSNPLCHGLGQCR